MTDIAQIGISIDTSDIKTTKVELDKMADSADSAGQEVEQLGDESQKAGKKVEAAGKKIKKAGNNVKGYEKQTDVATKKSKRFGQIAGQAGFQVNDFAVQVQGGQSALLAFSQQGSQLLGAFGAGGAIAGAVLAVGAAVGGVAFAQFSKGSASVEKYKTTIDQLRESLETLNKVQISGAIVDLKKKTKELEKEEKALEKTIKKLKEKQNVERVTESSNKRAQRRVATNNKHLIKQQDEIKEAEDALFNLKEKILDNNILMGKSQDAIKEKSGQIVDIEKKKTQVYFEQQQRLRMIADAKEEQKIFNEKAIEQENKELKLLERKLSAEASLKQAAEQQLKNAELARKAKLENQGQSFIDSILQDSKTEIEIIQDKYEKLFFLRARLGADTQGFEDAELALFKQFEEEKTRIAEEENAKRLGFYASGLESVATIFDLTAGFQEASNARRKKHLTEDIRNSDQFSKAQIKNKEAELEAIFESEKKARLNSIIASTGAAIMTQWATGNIGGAIAAGATGALQYAKVDSTSFSSPTGSPSGGGAVAQQEQQQTVKHEFNITSNIKDDANYEGVAVKSILERLQEELNQGGQMPA